MRTIFGFIAVSALLISASSADAQQFCTSRDKVIEQLQKQFEEQVLGRGFAANGTRMIELLVSESGSWTMLVSEPNGRSCVIASGRDWQGERLLVGDPA